MIAVIGDEVIKDVKFYRYILLVTTFLTLVFLSGCAPDESDLTPPKASFDGVVESPTTSPTAFILGTMDPGSIVTVYVSPTATVTGLTTSDNLWSFTLNDMVENIYGVVVTFTDEIGNSRSINLTIVVDLTGPVTTIDQYPLIAQPGMFTFAGTVTESNSAVSVEVFDMGGLSKAGPVRVSADADIWSANLDLSGFVSGDYTVSATGIDRLDNISITPTTQLVTLDEESPAFVISQPATLPVVLSDPSTVSRLFFDGTRLSGALLAVTSTSGVVDPVDLSDLSDPLLWNRDVSSLSAENSVVTFDVNDGGTIEKILVVRDQTVPKVVKWLSLDDTSVSVEFNESMNAATIEPANLTILDSNATLVNVSGVVSNGDRNFTFATDLLAAGETYTATLQTTDNFWVEDARGNSIGVSYVWTFKK